MPVGKLLVEGLLDVEIFTKVFDGTNIVRGGSKNSLRPQTRNDRAEKRSTMYLRDRDFDFLPPDKINSPTIDSMDQGTPIGLRLNLHELENYLLNPRVASAAFDIDISAWKSSLSSAGRRIVFYQIARWTIGQLRSYLPPNTHDLKTKPQDVSEMRLPSDLSESTSFDWCREAVVAFRETIVPHLSPSAVEAELERGRMTFRQISIDEPGFLQKWCSGKDMLAALDESLLQSVDCKSPKEVLNRLRDWVMKNPDVFLSFYPELQEIRKQLLA